MNIILLISALIVLRNLSFPEEVYAFYDSGAFIIRVNTVLGRCVRARSKTLETPKSLPRMLLFNLIRNVPNNIIRQLLYQGHLNFDSIMMNVKLSLAFTVIL